MPETDLDVLLVGIDAGCASVLDPLVEGGALPHLESVFEAGPVAPLESQVPPWTPSAWPSIYTGVNPGKHGVFSFLTYEGYDWELANATDVREHALWELADAHGLTSVVVNVPVTHPPDAFDGALVPGYMAPEEPRCHPRGLLDELREAVGDYRIYADPEADTREEKREAYRDLARMRGEAFRHLADRFDPEFGFVQFQVTDTVFHEFPGDDDLVRAVYAAVDEEVGATLSACDPDVVFVVSDHGIGEYEGWSFRVNEYLAGHGYVETTREGEGMPSWLPIRERRLQRGDSPTDGDRSSAWWRRALGAAARLGVTTERVGTVLSAIGLREAVAERMPADVVRVGTRRVDFPRSRAYMRARIETGVRINLEGREPDGVVSPEDYESVRDDLISLLSGVETPDGEPVFEAVARREQFFDGPAADRAVDVVTVPADFDHFLSADLLGEVFDEPGQPWNHKREGVIAAAGGPVDRDTSLEGAHLLDVAPTVLAALGLPASDRMDGRTLPVVEAVGREAYPAYESTRAASTDDDRVEAHLANLGYIDT